MTDYAKLAEEALARAKQNSKLGGYALYPLRARKDIVALASALREQYAEAHDLGVMYRCGLARIEELEQAVSRLQEDMFWANDHLSSCHAANKRLQVENEKKDRALWQIQSQAKNHRMYHLDMAKDKTDPSIKHIEEIAAAALSPTREAEK